MKIFSNHKSIIILFLFFILGLGLRLYGIKWDQGHHLHPDERFLTMVLTDTKLPASFSDYFNTNTSPLNPYNYPQFQFFVYGTLPIFLVKTLGAILNLESYDTVYLLGRSASAFIDALNIIVLYFLAKKIFTNKKAHLLPSLLYVFCVLPIQLSHFFAVDTFLAFFILLTFTLLVYEKFPAAAITFGMALACKITAAIFVPIIGVFIIQRYLKTKKVLGVLLLIVSCLAISFAMFRIFQPYAFTSIFGLNPHFLDNIKELRSISSSESIFPPSVQWLSKTPLLYSLQNIILWGIGIPVSILFVSSIFVKKPFLSTFRLVLAWIVLVYLYQGSQFAHNMRYFLVIYPFICLICAVVVDKIPKSVIGGIIFLHMLWAFMFVGIYVRPHSRVQASNWLYENIPARSKITNEYWDDPLPLYLPGRDPYIFSGTMLGLYDTDNEEKWQTINTILSQADFMIMSSNRLWGSIPLVPDRYPITSKFYQELFSEKLIFTKHAEINSYPGFELPFLKSCVYFGPTNFPGGRNTGFGVDKKCLHPGIYLRDDIAEESFTVYDHPKVVVFKKSE